MNIVLQLESATRNMQKWTEGNPREWVEINVRHDGRFRSNGQEAALSARDFFSLCLRLMFADRDLAKNN